MKTTAETTTICPLCGAARSETRKPSPGLRRAARSLAAHLAFVHNIRDGHGLACILGTDLELDNLEALTQWVEKRIAHLPAWPLSSEEVAALIDELEASLGRILETARLGRGHGLQ